MLSKSADRQYRRFAFTLMEMAMILVIVGLLTGGVLAGRHILRQSQIISVAVDEQRYVQAAQQFQTKYTALPGDFATATTYWGAAGGNSSDNWTSSCYGSGSAASPATCNGNGDGIILGQPGGDSTYANEQFRFWQHLTDAGMIQGQYTGVAGSAGYSDSLIGQNVPATRLEGVGFGIWYKGTQIGTASWFDGIYVHVFFVGNYTSGAPPINPALTASEAQAFDKKYDDGLPALGSIRTFKPAYLPNCATSALPISAAYAVTTSTGPQCSLIFITGF